MSGTNLADGVKLLGSEVEERKREQRWHGGLKAMRTNERVTAALATCHARPQRATREEQAKAGTASISGEPAA